MKPRTLQLPVTSKCNSRCVTCNIWKYKEKSDIDPIALKTVLSNPFFSRVKSVGLNGGEPFLHPEFVEVVKAVLSLKRIKHITVISNCICQEKTLKTLAEIYPLCKQKNVKLHMQISIDGVHAIHNKVRGVKISFDRSLKVIQTLKKNPGVYVDNFDLGYTISKYNVDYMVQTKEYFQNLKIPIYFHLAVPNKRIHNFNNAPFSVLTEKHATQMAKEFFYSMPIHEKKIIQKIRYTLIYLYLAGKTSKRMFICDYLYSDITINEIFDTFLCATASDKVGNLLEKIPTYKEYNSLVEPTSKHCDTCIHYANVPSLLGLYTFFIYKIKTFKHIQRYNIFS
ncbi:radical SAM protein [Alloprevotella sp. OH1205_COT-284]|uniref:radical SAM protein n=1 Tax=Alloprevotella sp. OH1205_COT-284 TaxID=2491043 RepID=UPI001F435E37|nr:radical SAM protein [Alloprevotella sp. OH1205_COT-284]